MNLGDAGQSLQDYADQQQRAATYWRQVVERIAEAMQTELRDPEQLVELAGRLAASANTPYATLRDQFAMACWPMHGTRLADARTEGDSPEACEAAWQWLVSALAYRSADAMIEARK